MPKRVLSMALLLALVLLVVGIVAAVTLLDARGLVAGRLSAMTGREVTIEEPVTLRLGLRPGLRIESMKLAPAEEGSRLHSASVGRLDLVFELWPLLRGRLAVHRLELDDAEVVLDPSAAEDTAGTGSGGARSFSLAAAEVRALRIELRRGGGTASTIANVERLSLSGGDEGRVVDVTTRGEVEGIDFDLSASYQREPDQASDRRPITLEGQVAGAEVSGEGSVAEQDGAPAIDLRLRADAAHLQGLSPAAQRELPRLGPLHASGRLQIRGGTIGLSEIDVQLGDRETAWLELSGHVGDVRSWREFELECDFGVADIHSLKPLVRDPPHIGTVAGRASFHDRTGTPGIEEFTLKGGLPGVFEIDAEGHFDDIRGVDGLEARIDLRARDLASIGELFHRTLPAVGPVEFSGQITGREREVSARNVRARLDRTHFRGSFAASLQQERRPSITATVEIPELYLDDIGIGPRAVPEPAEEPSSSEGGPSETPRRLFGEEFLEASWLRSADAQVSLQAGRVLGSSGVLASDLRLDASAAEGTLSVKHAAFHSRGGGAVDAAFEFDTVASPPTAALRADVKGMRLGTLFEGLHLPKVFSGTLDMKLDLETRGESPRALASHLDGRIGLVCGGGTIHPEYDRILMRDLIRSVQGLVGRRGETPAFDCLIASLEFEQGVGSVGTLVLDAADYAIIGEGEIDLARETIDLRLLPKPRKASILSTAATVRVSGPLRKPAVKVEKRSLVTSATRAVFGNLASAPGARQVWARLGRQQPADSPCARLMGSQQ